MRNITRLIMEDAAGAISTLGAGTTFTMSAGASGASVYVFPR